ncbi:MAG: glycosyltransferase [Candidatus Altiarchaeota archaeon]
MVSGFEVSIGVCAFNEGKNISKLLEALLNQKLDKAKINEIIVLSSGSTDQTDEIVKVYEKKDGRIRLVSQPMKEGKASAVNLFIKESKSDILILESGDTVPDENTVEELVTPLIDEEVAMVGGHPVPTNPKNSFIGYCVYLVWELHHRLSLIHPKAGEMVAFRKVIRQIPKETTTDEAWIESLVVGQGFQLAYAPNAIIKMHGPETIRDLVRQRRRIFVGHLHLREKRGYAPLTMSTGHVLKAISSIALENPLRIPYIMGAVVLEAYSRLAALWLFHVKGCNPYNWEVCVTTKKV